MSRWPSWAPLPTYHSPDGLCGRKATLNLNFEHLRELRSCVKVEVAVLGSPSLISLMVCGRKATLK